MLIKPCTYFYERYPATCKALRLVLVIVAAVDDTQQSLVNGGLE